MNDNRHRRTVQNAFEAGQETCLSEHNKIVGQLKSEILTELKAELQSNFAKLITSNSLTPRTSSRATPDQRSSKRRRLSTRTNDTDKQTDPLLATGIPASPSFGQLTVPPPPPKFWLYLTRVSRNVTVDQITKLAVDRLCTSDVQVARLVAKGKDISQMNFISFKIGMDESFRAKALSTTTWPEGLVFREFEDRSRGNFWEPPAPVQPTHPAVTHSTA